ncbi:MAG: hypothetical protein ACRCZE_00055 [Candidatus Altimarinota bacterium]
MQKKGNLFKLIKSLSKSEKRYIKISVKSTREDNNYLELFDFIDKQATYDEKAIKDHFHNKTFVKQLHVTKIYLTQLILKSLQSFYSKSSPEIILQNQLQEISILFQKELLELAENQIEKAITKATELENFYLLLLALEYKRQLLIQKFGATEAKKQLIEIIDRQNSCLKELFNLNEYYGLTANFFDYFQTTNNFNPTIYSTLDRHPLFQSPDQATSTQAKALFYQLQFSYQIYKNRDFEKAHQALENLVRLLERQPNIIQSNPQIYLKPLNDQISLLINTKNFAPIPELLKKVRQAPEKFKFSAKNKTIVASVFQTYSLELDLYLEIKDYNRAERLIEEIEQQLDFYHSPLVKQLKIQFFYQFSLIHFLAHNYIQSEKYLKTLYQNVPEAFSKNASIDAPHPVEEKYFQAKFLELFLHLKQQKVPLCRKISEQLSREIRSKRRLKTEEKALLEFFQRLGKRSSLTNLKNNLIEQLQTLESSENLTEIIWLLQSIPDEI